ncbi:MAG: DUF4249 domain-containing protein [Chitinophagaceae bacterium]|nr:DUF4249 domain-containing protein [Chitinophagaceae bacterium]
MFKRLIYWVIVGMVTVSCNKMIEIDVRDSDIKYVVEGVITNEPGVCIVNLTRSKNFDESNDFERISGAVVKVYDNEELFELQETEPGKYQDTSLTGTPGHIYRLEIVTGDEKFTSTCTMPEPVAMDSLYIKPGPFGQFKFATIDYTDPAEYNNGYRFVQYVNGVKEPTVFWENDEFTNGQFVTMQLDASAEEKDDPRNIKTGDEVMIEMQTIDEEVFTFWYTLRSGGGDGAGFSAAPSNPITNISGGALGYFSAHTIDRRTVVAP